jgi:hypothetical protein
VAAAELGGRAADLHDDIAGVLQVRRDDDVCVGHVGDGGDDQRRWNGVAGTIGTEVLVVQRVLAADERSAVGERRVAACTHRLGQLAECRRPPRIPPREVVEQRDLVGIGADGDDVAYRFVDDGVRPCGMGRVARTTG